MSLNRTPCSSHCDVGGEQVVGLLEAERDPLAGILRDGGEQFGVVAVDDEQALGIEAFDDAGVLAPHAGDVAEKFQMLGGAVGDDGDVGLGDLRQVADLAGMIRADFEDEIIVPSRRRGKSSGERRCRC